MQIVCSLTAEDYREFQEVYFDRLAGFWDRNVFKFFVSFGLVVILGGLNWTFYLRRSEAYGIICVLCGLFLVWRAAWLRFWQWQRWFRKNARLYSGLQYEINEEHLLTRSSTEETKAQWNHYGKYTETENLILLRDGLGSYLIFPKRAFNPADLGAFQDLLKRKVRCSF